MESSAGVGRQPFTEAVQDNALAAAPDTRMPRYRNGDGSPVDRDRANLQQWLASRVHGDCGGGPEFDRLNHMISVV